MTLRPVVADYALGIVAAAYSRHTRTGYVCVVITATGVMVVKIVDMVVIHVPVPRGIKGIVRRVIAPVVGRMPSHPRRSPEPVVDDGAVEIDRLNDVVLAVQVRVAYHLDGNCSVLLALHIDGSHVLIDILCQHRLQYNQAVLALAHFDDAQIIHVSVTVEVEVVQMAFFGIEFLLKLLKVVHFSEQGGYCTEVEVLGNVLTGRGNGNRFIGASRSKCKGQHCCQRKENDSCFHSSYKI